MTETNILLILKSASYFIQFVISIKRFVVENKTQMDRGLARRPPRQEQRVLEPPQIGDTKTLKYHGHRMHLEDPSLLLGGIADVGAGSAN